MKTEDKIGTSWIFDEIEQEFWIDIINLGDYPGKCKIATGKTKKEAYRNAAKELLEISLKCLERGTE